MIKKQHIEYYDGDTLLEGIFVYDDKHAGKRPALLIAHDWSGRNELVEKKAEKLAERGYAGFALDMYGKGVRGNTKEEKSALIQPFVQDRLKIAKRMQAALNTVSKLEQTDATRLGAIGFCFGGLCALDLARSGADVKGVVSFHGLLQAPEGIATHPIIAKVLVLHGYDDPMVTPEQVMNFGNEMTQAKVDWQLHMYGNTMHAFTNPLANDPAFGTVYNKQADERSSIAMVNFFREVFGE